MKVFPYFAIRKSPFNIKYIFSYETITLENQKQRKTKFDRINYEFHRTISKRLFKAKICQKLPNMFFPLQ